jgi:hypothetical protein
MPTGDGSRRRSADGRLFGAGPAARHHVAPVTYRDTGTGRRVGARLPRRRQVRRSSSTTTRPRSRHVRPRRGPTSPPWCTTSPRRHTRPRVRWRGLTGGVARGFDTWSATGGSPAPRRSAVHPRRSPAGGQRMTTRPTPIGPRPVDRCRAPRRRPVGRGPGVRGHVAPGLTARTLPSAQSSSRTVFVGRIVGCRRIGTAARADSAVVRW